MASILENEYEKHPLEHTWNLWLINDINKNLWKVNLQNLAEFDTVEDYWCFYHHTKLPSELEVGQDYAVFKKGTSPRWEDEFHCDGGRWFINMQKRKRELDIYWLDVVLLMIGENFGEANDIISGAVVSVRKTVNKIWIWTRETSKLNLMIGNKIKKQLQINFQMTYHTNKNNRLLYKC